MPMPISGTVGPASGTDGIPLLPLRQGRQGELIVQQLHGRYYESALRQRIFSGGNAAGQVTTVGAATTYTGLCLSNPIGSGVNLVLNKLAFTSLVAPAAAMIVGLMTGFHAATQVTQTTPIVPAGNYIGQGAGAGLLASAATLPIAPTLRTVLGGIGTVAVTSENVISDVTDMEGSILIPPGGFAAFFTSTASAAAGMAFSFQWEEQPVAG